MTVIIGLEIHCQLTTKTKLFCGCSTDYRNDPPNTHTCPTCLGLPGSLPVLNRKAVEYALRVGKALNCTIPGEAEFARKNYFYPDLPKGFQITMYDRPLAVDGHLEIEGDDGTEKSIRITRVHMEEDPGRLVHMGSGDRPRYSLVDYNRSGIPLIEIVTDPDLRSPKEARRFINTLRTTLEYLGVFDGEREGGLRVDANISMEGGNRVEVKNISSYKGVEKALTFEITRQRNVLRRGLAVERETRHFLEARGVTTSARSKEEEHDYRYFPEPDLRPLRVQGWFDKIVLPELPAARKEKFIMQYCLSPTHGATLSGDKFIADYFEDVLEHNPDDVVFSQLVATNICDTLLGELNYRDMSREDMFPAEYLRELMKILRNDEITDKGAVEVLRTMLNEVDQKQPLEKPRSIITRLNLGKAGGDEFGPAIREVVSANPAAVRDLLGGKGEALNFLVGQAMKKTRGRADPKELARMIREAIGREELAP